ncbi:MAG: choice-of-anchor B family protein, partial [Owenweeksia sp.]
MKKLVLFMVSFIMMTPLLGQDSLAINKLGKLAYTRDLNDVWGYADANGNEYALVGVRDGFSVVDISNPATPTEVAFFPGASSTWRDIKTWDHYAYVVHDGYFSTQIPNGILIVDMDSVNMPSPKFNEIHHQVNFNGNNYTLNRAHNIYIDENGILYVFGSDVAAGGAVMFDLKPNPEQPTYLGIFNANYLHDGMVRGDTLWGGAINDDKLVVVNVANKSNPTVMGSMITPGAFTHNCWISDDNRTVYTTDEISGAFVTAYDVTDLNDISERDRIRISYGGPDVIPHNTHVMGDFLVTSFYTSGLQIVDATKPDILIETAYYDTSPFTGTGYHGAWGAYPYLPSGNILVTDIEQGLFVLSSTYPKGCYFTGLVKDSVTQNPIPNAQLQILNLNRNLQADVFGKFKTGTVDAALYPVIVSKPGYITDTVDVLLNNGVETHVEIALLPLGFSVDEYGVKMDIRLSP